MQMNRTKKVILSASRRTDIPAFYSDWFFKRLAAGFALTGNPMNPAQIRRVSMKREEIQCIVFWTKNPERMLRKLDLLQGIPYYFQFTLNPYGALLEPNVPEPMDAVRTFQRLSERIGPQRVIWRYDPVVLSRELDAGWHEKQFEEFANRLHEYTDKCIFSYIDYYQKIDKCYCLNGITDPDDNAKAELASRFAEIAAKYGLKLETCSEEIDLSGLGIGHACCIDPVFIEKLSGEAAGPRKDRNQRKACGCCPSVDIGTYNTCLHSCSYCYANFSPVSVKRNREGYDPDSPLLCGKEPIPSSGGTPDKAR